MIAIQILLIAGFVFLLYKLLASPNSYQLKAMTKMFGIIFSASAICAVLFPDVSNTVAGWVGVTRGADLLLYFMALAFTFLVLNIYIKEKQESRRTVVLARKIAIMEANIRHRQNKGSSG